MGSTWKEKIGNRERGLSHHAFLIEGEILATRSELRDFLESEHSIITAGNPDYFEFHYKTFGIDEGRELKVMQSRHSFETGAKKIFIIDANSFTIEAQNSLLKIFEEPTADTHYFILSSSIQFFLPTLLSRVVSIFSERTEVNDDVEVFLKKNYAERSEFATTLSKDSVAAKQFIENILQYFYNKTNAENRTAETTKILALLNQYRTFAYGRSPSMKNILEHLSLILPIV